MNETDKLLALLIRATITNSRLLIEAQFNAGHGFEESIANEITAIHIALKEITDEQE